MKKKDCLVREIEKNGDSSLISFEEFFDGNDDIESIAPFLSPHPGLAVFKRTFEMISHDPNVEAVYFLVDNENEPGWPCCRMIFIVGNIEFNQLQRALLNAHPDDFGNADDFPVAVPEKIGQIHPGSPVQVVFWHN